MFEIICIISQYAGCGYWLHPVKTLFIVEKIVYVKRGGGAK